MKEKFVQKAFRLAWYLIAFGSFKLVWSQNVSLANHTNTVCSIKFTSDSHGNRFLVSSSTDGKINFWNKADPNWSLKDQINNGGSVNSIISLPNEQLASSLDGNIKVWSVLNKTLIKTLTRYSYGIFQLAISPNQQMIASAENDYASRVWNISTGKCISTMYGHTNSVQSVVFFSNEILITGSYDTSIKVWNITNVPGTCLRTLTGHTLTVVSLVVLPNSLLASGAADSSIKIWNVTNGSCLATLSGHSDYVFGLTLLSNGLLASGSQDGTIKIWSLTSFSCIKVFFIFYLFKLVFFSRLS